ncbi:MAG: DUF6056 family protein [Dysgonomonas sp.]
MPAFKTQISDCLTNRKLRIFLFLFSVVSVFGVILFLNIKTPVMGDDFTYKYIFNTTQEVHNFEDVVKSQQEHYRTWGGRTVVHTIAQMLLLTDSLTMDIFNTCAFLLLIFLIYFHINYRKPFSVSLFIGIFLLLWFMLPFGETVLWITGSANYLWGTLIILGFLFPYRAYEGNRNGKAKDFVFILIMLVAGVIAGWTNENTAAAMIVMIVLFLIKYKREKRQIPLWGYSGLLGALIGYFVMIAAPGNSVRAGEAETDAILVFYRLFRYTQLLFNEFGLLIVVFVILLYLSGKLKNSKTVIANSLIYAIGVLVAVYVMILSPSFPERALFGAICLSVIALGVLVVNMHTPLICYAKYLFILLGLTIFTLNSYDVCKDVNMVNRIMAERTSVLNEAKGTGSEVVFEHYHTQTRYAVPDPAYSAPVLSILFDVKVEYKGIE